MVRRKEAKIAALFVVGFSMILCFLDVSFPSVGIFRGCRPYARLTYHFFHVSLVHWFSNAWCLLSLFFIYGMSLKNLFTAYLLASIVPICVFPVSSFTVPTVGLSGICFVLMGRIALFVERKLYYQAWLIIYLAVGFLFPGSNGWLHLYCYIAGLFVGFLNKPLI